MSTPNTDEMKPLISFPPEILHNILLYLDPVDLVVLLPRVSRELRTFVKGNQSLARDSYLSHFDHLEGSDLDWVKELHDLVKLEAICDRKAASDKKHELPFVYETVTRMLKHASPANEVVTYSDTHHPSYNVGLLRQLFTLSSNVEAFLERSSLFERVRQDNGHRSSTLVHQQSAKLHCLYSRPILNLGRTRSLRTYPFACSKVYDLRQYTQLTKWGPFMNDDTDRVDWEKVEAIIIVLGHNIRKKRFISRIFNDVWNSPFAGSWPGSYVSSPLDLQDSTQAQDEIGESSKADESGKKLHSLNISAQDPYGVTGIWYRVICFLDYGDLFAFNFPEGSLLPEDGPRHPLDVGEAIRLITMSIKVTAIRPPGPEDGQALPVVHFRGLSKTMDDSWDVDVNSEIRGTVRLTREGEVRWTTFSVFHGQERWRTEGVQIGGVRSARGVVGNWFDKDYDERGPAGPTAFWKAASAPSNPSVILHDALPDNFFNAYENSNPSGEDSESEGEILNNGLGNPAYQGHDDEGVDDEEE